MMLRTHFRYFSISLFFVLQLSGVAAPPPLDLEHTVDLNDFRGKTFLQAMTATRGIKAHLDEDYVQKYDLIGWETAEAALENFDTKNVNKVLRSFEDREEGLQSLVEAIEGESFSPANIVKKIGPQLEGGDVFAVAQFLAMASGAGTLVTLNEDNYYYNYGYKSGENKDDVKSGRSFGAGPVHNANDASDVFYLTELENYMNETKKPAVFYETMMDLLTQCDTSGYESKGLSPLGETVLTDFLAIYTAESDRHIMVDLNPVIHPWENDLAEVTFVSAYGTAVGMIMSEGELQEGAAKEWWAMSEVSNRSGIGITRRDRRALQRLISNYEREHNPEIVEAVEEIIGGKGPNGDLYRGLMEYLNDFDTQKDVQENSKALTKAFVKFVLQTREDAEAITAEILGE